MRKSGGGGINVLLDSVRSMDSQRAGSAVAEVERGAGVIYDADVAAAALRMFRLHGYRIPNEDRPMRFRG